MTNLNKVHLANYAKFYRNAINGMARNNRNSELYLEWREQMLDVKRNMKRLVLNQSILDMP